jgi:GGDEF domain-containing protein
LQLERALHRIHQAGDGSINLGAGQQVQIGMSMGIALFPHDGEHADALLRRADAAMYEVKQQKGKRLTWWNMTATPGGVAA